MRLLTLQQLQCPRPRCEKPFPLRLQLNTDNPEAVEIIDSDVNIAFIKRIIPTIDYTYVRNTAAESLGLKDLPEMPPQNDATEKNDDDEQFYTKLHNVLMDVHINDGVLLCESCNRKYPVQKGKTETFCVKAYR